MFEKTNCDAVMIGRASLGNPWFFNQAKALLSGKPVPSTPPHLDKISYCIRHFNHMIDWHGEKRATDLIKKHFGWYIKGFPEASLFREKLVRATSIKEMRMELDRLIKLSESLSN